MAASRLDEEIRGDVALGVWRTTCGLCEVGGARLPLRARTGEGSADCLDGVRGRERECDRLLRRKRGEERTAD